MLAREDKNNKESFFGYVLSKKKSKEVVGSVWGDDGVMVTADRDKAEVFNTFFALVFSQKENDTQVGENEAENTGKGIDCRIEKEVIQQYLATLNEIKSPGPDELHSRVLKELAEEISEPLAIIFEKSWRTGEVPMDWRKANMVPIFKKGEKEVPNNYRPVSLTAVPGKIMEQIIKQAVCKHLMDHAMLNKSQHGFLRNKSCQTNLISFSKE